MQYQFPIPLWPIPHEDPNFPPRPKPEIVHRKVQRPAWYGDPPPDDAEMERRARERDEALTEYQRQFAEFDRTDPPLPVRWDNWREAKARDQRCRAALRDVCQRLDHARKQYRRGICQRAVKQSS